MEKRKVIRKRARSLKGMRKSIATFLVIAMLAAAGMSAGAAAINADDYDGVVATEEAVVYTPVEVAVEAEVADEPVVEAVAEAETANELVDEIVDASAVAAEVAEGGYIGFAPASLHQMSISLQIQNPVNEPPNYNPSPTAWVDNLGTLPDIIPDVEAIMALDHFDNVDWSEWRVAFWTLGLSVSPAPGQPNIHIVNQQEIRTGPVQYTLPSSANLDVHHWGTHPIFRIYLEEIPAPTLTGTLVCSDTGRPIPGVTVTANGMTVVTDEDGFFDFGEVPEGEIEISFGEVPHGYSAPQPAPGDNGFIVDIIRGEDHHQDFVVDPPAPLLGKAVTPAMVNPGDTVTYTITVDTDNTMGTYNPTFTTGDGDGPTYFKQLEVVDELYHWLTFNPGSLTVAGVSDFDYDFDSATRTLTVYNMVLEGNAEDGYATEVVITFTATVSQDATQGSIPNTAYLNNANTGTTIDTGDVTVTLTPLYPELAIMKSSNPAGGATDESAVAVGRGGAIDYVLTIVNTGDGSASNVVSVDEVPTYLTINADEIRGNFGDNAPVSAEELEALGVGIAIEGQAVTWAIQYLPADDSFTLVIPTVVNSDAPNGQILRNIAAIVSVNDVDENIVSGAIYHQVSVLAAAPDAKPDADEPDTEPTPERRPATGPKTGDANNWFVQLAVLALLVVAVAGKGLLHVREQD